MVLIILFLLSSVAIQVRGEDLSNMPEERETVAVFPFENESMDINALSAVMSLVKAELQKRGFELLDDAAVREFLVEHRLRQSGYISEDIANSLMQEYGVSAVLLGCIIAYEAKKNPVVAVHARVVDTESGDILWAGFSSATGEDFVGLFGLGGKFTMQSLTPEVIERLFSTFPLKLSREQSGDAFRIAVLPFRNISKKIGAGSIATYLYITELFRSPIFQPVEFGNIREAVVELKLRPKGEVDYTILDALAEMIDVDGFIIGTVDEYREEINLSLPPQVSIAARLLDAQSKKLLWYDYTTLNGNDEIKILDFGKMRSADRVAYRIVQRHIRQLEEQIWTYEEERVAKK